MKKRIECIVSGRVQMVMFRDFTCRKARGLGLVGFVKNQLDGTVNVIAEGEEKDLKKLIEMLYKGPILSKVISVEVLWGDAGNTFKEFSIQY